MTFLDDLRQSIRRLIHAPGFCALVILTLALGIGASTALFSVVNGVLLNPLPYPQPRQLTVIYAGTPQDPHGYVTYPNFQDWQRNSQSFAAMAIYRNQDFLLTGNGPGERLTGMMVSAGFFRTLGVHPALGRGILASDDKPGAGPVVVLGGGLWRRRFGGSPRVLGQGVNLNGVLYTVVGVLPDGFQFYGIGRDAYTAIGQWTDPNFRDRKVDVSTRAIGRLAPGVTLAQAQGEMKGIARTLAQLYPEADKNVTIGLMPLKTDLVGGVQPFLYVLLAAVGFLLLIACVNVANLQLARATGQTREYAIRAALGASSRRLLRQMFTESLILALLGGALGLALAALFRSSLGALLPATLPNAAATGLDGRVLGFTLAVSVLAAVIFGCAPALRGARADALTAVRAGERGASGRTRMQGVFVACQIAMALILLAGAGLMLRTLANLWRVDLGYNPSHAITFDLSLPDASHATPAQTRARLRAFDAALMQLPGVEAESVTLGSRPMIHDSSLPIWIQGRPKPAEQTGMPQSLFYLAEGGYAKAMGLTLLRGRFLTDQDTEHTAPVIVIDDVFARTLFPHQDPIGQLVNITGFNVQARIVGVVGHVKQWGPQADAASAIEAQFYYPFMQMPEKLMPLAAGGAAVIVRTAGDPATLIPEVRRRLPGLDPREIVYQAQTVEDLVASSLAARRAAMTLLTLFGALALVLAAVGIYGVVSYFVGRRTREIGIRIALGSGRGAVLRLVLGEALGMALWGVGAGLVIALPLTRLMHGLLYGVGAADPITYLAVSAGLVGVALLACYLPARRATRVDPLIALRAE